MKKFLVFLVIMWCGVVYGQIPPVFINPDLATITIPVEDHILFKVNVDIAPSDFFSHGAIGNESIEVTLSDTTGVSFNVTLDRALEITFDRGPVESLWFGTVNNNAPGNVIHSYIARTINGQYYARIYYEETVYEVYPEITMVGIPPSPTVVHILQNIDPALIPVEDEIYLSVSDEFLNDGPVQIGTIYSPGTDYEIDGLIGIAPEVYDTNYTLEHIAMKMTGEVNSTFINTGINNVKITLQFENLQCPDSDPDCTECTPDGFYCNSCSDPVWGLLPNPGSLDNDSMETCKSTYRWNYREMWQNPCGDGACALNDNRGASYCDSLSPFADTVPNPYIGHLDRCGGTQKGLAEYVGAGFVGIVTFYRFVRRDTAGNKVSTLNGEGSHKRKSLISRIGGIMQGYLFAHEFGHVLDIDHTAEVRAMDALRDSDCNNCSCFVKEHEPEPNMRVLTWDCSGNGCNTAACTNAVSTTYDDLTTPDTTTGNDAYYHFGDPGPPPIDPHGPYYKRAHASVAGEFKFHTVTGNATRFMIGNAPVGVSPGTYFERGINAFSRSNINYCSSTVPPVCGSGGNSVYADAYHYLTEAFTEQIDTNGDPVIIQNPTTIDNFATRYQLTCPVKVKWCADNDKDGVCDDRLTVIEVCDGENPNDSGTNTNYIPDNGSLDNCPGVYNPRTWHNPWSEFVSGDRGGFKKGAAALNKGVFQNDGGLVLPILGYYMQPDHNLSGVGDACDYNSMGGDGFAYSRIFDIRGEFPRIPFVRNIRYDSYAKVSLNMPRLSGREVGYCEDSEIPGLPGMPGIYGGSRCNAAVHYCAISHLRLEQGLWGTRGHCSTSEKEGGAYGGFHFGYSHGSDDFSPRSIESWQNRISVIESSKGAKYDNWDESTKEAVGVSSSVQSFFLTSEDTVFWNWRKDWWDENRCDENPEQPVCQSLETGGSYVESNTMYYALSTSVLPVPAGTPVENYPEYYLGTGENISINPAYFPDTHTNIFTRSSRYATSSNKPMKLNYHVYQLEPLPPDVSHLTIDIPEIKFCRYCHTDIPLDYTLKGDLSPVDWLYSVVGRWFTGKDFEGNYIMDAQRLVFPENMLLFTDLAVDEMIAVKETSLPAQGGTEYELMINTSQSGADWHSIGVLNDWDEYISSIKAITGSDNGLYFIASSGSTHHQIQLYNISADFIPEGPIDPQNIPEITYTLNNLGSLSVNPESFSDMKMISDGDNVYLVSSISAADTVRIFRLNENNDFTDITGSGNIPPARKILNIAIENGYMFLTGGINYNNQGMTDLWRFDLTNGGWELITGSLQGDFRKVITQPVDGKLVMGNPVIYRNTTHSAFEIDPSIENVAEINIDYVDIPVTVVEITGYDGYCLSDNDGYLKGGLEAGGECVPFSNPWYRTFSVGTTVVNVEGRGDRFYAGTSGSVRVYDISDPEDMVLLHTFSTGSTKVWRFLNE
jgi:hypothetical protein